MFSKAWVDQFLCKATSFSFRLFKQGSGPGYRSRTGQPPLLLCTPAQGRERSNLSPRPIISEPSAWWHVMLAARAEGWDVCPCCSFLQAQSGPEQLETLVSYVPLALFCSLPAHRVHWRLLLSLTNAIINLRTLLLDHSNILFKIIIWKITWQRTLLLFLLWKGARFTKGLQAGLG